MGGEVDEDGNEEETSIGDLVMHFISLFWKVKLKKYPNLRKMLKCSSGPNLRCSILVFYGNLSSISTSRSDK